MSGARPGWYPDPGGARGRFRWWDGRHWTRELTDSAQAPAPNRARPVRDGRPFSTAAAWTVGIALVTVAGVVLGLVVWLDPVQSAGPAAARATPRPSVTSVPGELDSDTRQATIGTATMALPDEPYRIRTDPMTADGLFDSYFLAGAVVHNDYRDRRDWSALVGIAHVDSHASGADPESTATAVARGIADRFFAGQPTTISGLRVAEHSVDGCSGVLLTADVGYRIDGLASRSDRLSVMVVRLDDGTQVAAFSSVPTDASADLRGQAGSALESLHAG